MDKINMNLTKNIGGNMAGSFSSEYENVKSVYCKYIKSMEKSDFANSLTRYQVENSMLRKLNSLLSPKQKDEKEFIVQRYEIVSQKLKEFGVVPEEI